MTVSLNSTTNSVATTVAKQPQTPAVQAAQPSVQPAPSDRYTGSKPPRVTTGFLGVTTGAVAAPAAMAHIAKTFQEKFPDTSMSETAAFLQSFRTQDKVLMGIGIGALSGGTGALAARYGDTLLDSVAYGTFAGSLTGTVASAGLAIVSTGYVVKPHIWAPLILSGAIWGGLAGGAGAIAEHLHTQLTKK